METLRLIIKSTSTLILFLVFLGLGAWIVADMMDVLPSWASSFTPLVVAGALVDLFLIFAGWFKKDTPKEEIKEVAKEQKEKATDYKEELKDVREELKEKVKENEKIVKPPSDADAQSFIDYLRTKYPPKGRKDGQEG